MRTRLLLLLILLVAYGCSAGPDPLVDVPALSQKTVAEVNAILGQPVAEDPPDPTGAISTTYPVEGFSVFLVTYRQGVVSSVFGELKEPVTSHQDCFALIGLPDAAPDHHAPGMESAHDAGGWKEVSVFRAERGGPFYRFNATNAL